MIALILFDGVTEWDLGFMNSVLFLTTRRLITFGDLLPKRISNLFSRYKSAPHHLSLEESKATALDSESSLWVVGCNVVSLSYILYPYVSVACILYLILLFLCISFEYSPNLFHQLLITDTNHTGSLSSTVPSVGTPISNLTRMELRGHVRDCQPSHLSLPRDKSHPRGPETTNRAGLMHSLVHI
jgi:hypothetical protein